MNKVITKLGEVKAESRNTYPLTLEVDSSSLYLNLDVCYGLDLEANFFEMVTDMFAEMDPELPKGYIRSIVVIQLSYHRKRWQSQGLSLKDQPKVPFEIKTPWSIAHTTWGDAPKEAMIGFVTAFFEEYTK